MDYLVSVVLTLTLTYIKNPVRVAAYKAQLRKLRDALNALPLDV